jgi:hypothetical protein
LDLRCGAAFAASRPALRQSAACGSLSSAHRAGADADDGADDDARRLSVNETPGIRLVPVRDAGRSQTTDAMTRRRCREHASVLAARPAPRKHVSAFVVDSMREIGVNHGRRPRSGGART